MVNYIKSTLAYIESCQADHLFDLWYISHITPKMLTEGHSLYDTIFSHFSEVVKYNSFISVKSGGP